MYKYQVLMGSPSRFVVVIPTFPTHGQLDFCDAAYRTIWYPSSGDACGYVSCVWIMTNRALTVPLAAGMDTAAGPELAAAVTNAGILFHSSLCISLTLNELS